MLNYLSLGFAWVRVPFSSGNRSIGRLPALGVGGCEFKSHFLESMLELVILFPVMGILNILIRGDEEKLKQIALEWSLLTLIATIILWASFDGEGQFQVIKKFEWVPGSALFAVDGISLFFLILTALLTPICVLIS